jgi:FkbM family methyltransferase
MGNSIAVNVIGGLFKRLKRLKANPYAKTGLRWMDIKVIKNLPDNKLNRIKFLGGTVTTYGKREFLHALDEIYVDEIYKLSLPENALIIDCGAHIGLSVIYLKKQTPSARVIAFEPDEKNFKLLQANITSFQFEGVEIKQEAVWIENTVLNFSNSGSMSSKIEEASQDGVNVKASRLKDILNTKVDFLKLDIEGAEYIVLKDIEEKLVNVENLFIEYHGTFLQNKELVEVLEMIERTGFKFYIKEAFTAYPHPFIPAEKNDTVYDVQLNIFCFRK